MTTKTVDALDVLREAADLGQPAPRPLLEARGAFLVRDKAGRPKFDLPMGDYPYWAQVAFFDAMTPAERKEFF